MIATVVLCAVVLHIKRSDLAIGVDIEREDRILQFGDPERKGWRIQGDEVHLGTGR